MATTEESLKFLEEARAAAESINAMKLESEDKAVQLKRAQKNLESEQKSVSDTIADTIKKRRAETIKPFDTQISDLQGQLKKEHSKREKARNVGMKTRIEAETAQLNAETREINNRIKMISSRNGVPGYCSSSLFQIMSSPRGAKEIIILLHDKKRRIEMGQRGQAAVKRDFGWRHMAHIIEEEYKKGVGNSALA